MSSPAWEDLDVFLQLDDFAVSAVIHLQAGGTRQVIGILDDPYLSASAGGFDRDQVRPTLQLKETDAVGVHRGDWVVTQGRTYDIMTAPQGDGTGMALLDMARR